MSGEAPYAGHNPVVVLLLILAGVIATPWLADVWWSSDSTIVYDIEGDGKGAITKDLLGSPLIHG